MNKGITVKVRSKIGSKFGGMVRAKSGLFVPGKPRGFWGMECYRNGELIWSEEWENIITTAGLNYLIGCGLSGTTQITTWYIGLVSGASPSFDAADVPNNHSGWTESTAYDETNRVTFVGIWLGNEVSPLQQRYSEIAATFLSKFSKLK